MKRKLAAAILLAGALGLTGYFVSRAFAQSSTNPGFSASRVARWAGEAVTAITGSVTIPYAFAATSNYQQADTIIIANGVGTDLYISLWPSATSGTTTASAFHLILKTSETLTLSRSRDPNLFPIRGFGIFQDQIAAPGVGLLQINAYD